MSDYDPRENRAGDELTDEELLWEAREGNGDALATFCSRVLPKLTWFVEYQCRQFRIPSHLVEDFTQSALTHAVAAVGRRGAGPEFPVAWLKKIAYRIILDWMERERRQVGHVVYCSEATSQRADELAFEEFDQQDELEEIHKYFDWLSSDQKDLIEMVCLKGLTVKDAGKALGLGKHSAYKTYERGLGMLREILAQYGEHSKIRRN